MQPPAGDAKGFETRSHVGEVVAFDPHTVRFVLHEPWPDFMTFYGTFASAAGSIMSLPRWRGPRSSSVRPTKTTSATL